MLDENLPTFFLKASTAGTKHHRDVHFSQHGNSPEPAYEVRYVDPTNPSPDNKNCYAAGLFDAHSGGICYGEVFARPEVVAGDPTTSSAGSSVLYAPADFTIDLYDPDMKVKVESKESKWSGSLSWEFSLPESVFRTPSASMLDQTAEDPASLASTPRIHFAWRKESKLSKDLTCYVTGKSTSEARTKRAKKDPDITVALWRSMRELTIYEPNLSRVEMEDPKGLEIVLVISAIIIKDMYFTPREAMRQLFNVAEGTTPRPSPATKGALAPPPPRPLDPETARLKAQTEAEAQAAARRREQQAKADEAEAKRLQQVMEAEEREARRKQAEVDKETERLRALYGVPAMPPSRPGRAPGHPHPQHQHQHQKPTHLRPPPQPGRPQQPPHHTGPPTGAPSKPYRPSASATSLMMSGGNPGAASAGPSQPKKSSFFGFRRRSEDEKKLQRKRSVQW